MKKKIIFCIIIALVVLPFTQIISETVYAQIDNTEKVKEGDVIFQTS